MSDFPKDNPRPHLYESKPNVRFYREARTCKKYIVAMHGDWYYPLHACHDCITQSFWFFYDRYYSWKSDAYPIMFKMQPEIPGKLISRVRDHFAACARKAQNTVGQCPVCAATNRVLWPVPCIDAPIIVSGVPVTHEMQSFRPEFVMTEQSPELLGQVESIFGSPGDAPLYVSKHSLAL